MTDFLMNYAWIAWLALILLFVVVETLTLELTFLMLAIGGLGGLTADLLGAPWWLQIMIAALLSLLLLLLLKPPLLRALRRGGDPAKSNLDALLGLVGQVVTPVTEYGGHVKLSNGELWTAKVAPQVAHRNLVEGERVVVTAIEGTTAFVVPSEGNSSQ
ncbi:NfeD family protein [Planctomonas psychrotolerans]|uniref:NfeD family protein n=1 Tax=Planctomonas psychrotolerans TaxID=2528712 RepID=UPI001D0D068B|nr:NfeD family protein [Planctomonas psychrotolerans]